MKVQFPFGLTLCVAMLVCGCQSRTATDAAASAELLQADQAFSADSVQQGFAAAFRSHALDDAVFLPQGGAAVHGAAQIAGYLGQVPDDTHISWTPQGGEASGKLGYTWGIYTLSGGGKHDQATLAYGKYLSAWKRRDGHWKLAAMMTNQSPGPAG
ncbi:MAG TPA: DUF4440 domain-containing protein [Gammaproteobacteria bacterium]|nr:DUF4440 domain-containing protein [Gammaproteobacteria bacterium]